MTGIGSAQAPASRHGGAYAVTFVCTGNICRSPMADVIARAIAETHCVGDRVTVTSSATGGWHVGDGADPRTVASLERAGYDGNAHRARTFDASLFHTYDLVVAMDRSHIAALRELAMSGDDLDRIVLLRDFDPEGSGEVPDPYYGTEKDFDDVRDMVERSTKRLMESIERVVPVR